MATRHGWVLLELRLEADRLRRVLGVTRMEARALLALYWAHPGAVSVAVLDQCTRAVSARPGDMMNRLRVTLSRTRPKVGGPLSIVPVHGLGWRLSPPAHALVRRALQS